MTHGVGRLRLRSRALAAIIGGLLVQAGFAAPQGPGDAEGERIASNVAEKFAWALSFGAPFAYELLSERGRLAMPPPQFIEALSHTFPDGPPGALEATHIAAAGPGSVDVFLTGRSRSDRGYVRVRMARSAARGFAVREFERMTTGLPASARPAPPDTGPFPGTTRWRGTHRSRSCRSTPMCPWSAPWRTRSRRVCASTPACRPCSRPRPPPVIPNAVS